MNIPMTVIFVFIKLHKYAEDSGHEIEKEQARSTHHSYVYFIIRFMVRSVGYGRDGREKRWWQHPLHCVTVQLSESALGGTVSWHCVCSVWPKRANNPPAYEVRQNRRKQHRKYVSRENTKNDNNKRKHTIHGSHGSDGVHHGFICMSTEILFCM